jgi:hypothetical protein
MIGVVKKSIQKTDKQTDDFAKIHKKQFSSTKRLTDIVERVSSLRS